MDVMVAAASAVQQAQQSHMTIAPMSTYLKDNLKRLKNLLKLPKARRWVLCELFYSEVDRELFLGENEFEQCLRDSFPNLKTRQMNRQQWRKIRALIGKPRRCSQAFFDEEVAALNQRRQRLRDLYQGNVLAMDADVELPARVPRPLAVGNKVYVRVHEPRDGIFVGTVDALMDRMTRVLFDKEDMLIPQHVPDTEVMRECEEQLVPISYYIEKSRASFPGSSFARTMHGGVTLTLGTKQDRSTLIKYDPILSALAHRADSNYSSEAPLHAVRAAANLALSGKDEKVGNFPVRMLVMLVKGSKLIDMKKELIRKMTVVNDTCHRMTVLTSSHPPQLQEQLAEMLLDMAHVNGMIELYVKGVAAYQSVLLPHLTNVPITSRPEALRKLCHSHGTQIVKFCNQGLNVRSQRAINLITALTALLLQVRALGHGDYAPHELHSLTEALNDMRDSLSPANLAPFQDHVEVHMRQINDMMLKARM